MIFVKKTMRFVALILSVAILSLSFAGCGGGSNSFPPDEQVEWVSEDFKNALFAAAENADVWNYGLDEHIEDIEVIEFSDQPTSADLAEVERIRFVFEEGEEIAELDLRDIEKFPNLRNFSIECEAGSIHISDLSPLAGLTNLKHLSISHTSVSDWSPLSKLTELKELGIGFSDISDLSPLSGLTNLELLQLFFCEEVSDISPLEGLTNLQALYLDYCTELSDLSPLAGLTKLEDLDIQFASVSDLSPLAGLTNLERLNISGTEVSDLSSLAKLTNLRALDAEDTNVTDWSPVAHVPNIVK
jgi:hypothetical protein